MRILPGFDILHHNWFRSCRVPPSTTKSKEWKYSGGLWHRHRGRNGKKDRKYSFHCFGLLSSESMVRYRTADTSWSLRKICESFQRGPKKKSVGVKGIKRVGKAFSRNCGLRGDCRGHRPSWFAADSIIRQFQCCRYWGLRKALYSSSGGSNHASWHIEVWTCKHLRALNWQRPFPKLVDWQEDLLNLSTRPEKGGGRNEIRSKFPNIRGGSSPYHVNSLPETKKCIGKGTEKLNQIGRSIYFLEGMDH